MRAEGLPELHETVNSGLTWTASQIKSACPHKRKKLDEEGGDSEKSGGDGRDDLGPSATPRRAPKTDSKTDSGIDSKTDSKTDSGIDSKTDSKTDSRTDSEIDPKTSPYGSPGQICPPVKPRCFIKMQDPCAPCCCETKPKPPPCPPKHGPQEPREPICDCELCQKNPNNEKCCDKSKTLRGITIDRGYFEKA